MDHSLEDMTDRLPPLLIEARNMLHLHDRAGAVGILVEGGFVRCCRERWNDAISDLLESVEAMKAAESGGTAGAKTRG